MPFQPINFASIPVQGDPAARGLSDAFNNMINMGFKTYDMLQQADANRRKAKADEFINALKQQQALKLQNELTPENLARQAQTQDVLNAFRQTQTASKNIQNQLPLGGNFGPGLLGDALRNKAIQEQLQSSQKDEALPIASTPDQLTQSLLGLSKNNSSGNQFQNAYDTEYAGKQATINRNNKLTGSQDFRSLPIDEKKRVTATTTGMGYEPTEATSLLSQGYTLKDLADNKGLNLKDVEPNYPLSNSQITQKGNREAFVKELDNISNNIKIPLSKVSRKILDLSPVQLAGQLGGMSADEQGEILAAQALMPEFNSLRFKTLGGNVGIGALNHLEDTSHTKSQIFESLVSPEAFKSMNDHMEKWISEANDAFSNSLSDKSRLGKSPNIRPKSQDESADTDYTWDPKLKKVVPVKKGNK